MDEEHKIGETKIDGERISIWQSHYDTNDRVAIELRGEDGQPYSVLTVNLDDNDFEDGVCPKLLPGEFFVRSNEYSQDTVRGAMESGLFEDTGKTVTYGRGVTGLIWKFKT
jgi:hypothetical protein